MKIWIAILLLLFAAFAACKKENKVSKIPHIKLTAFGPDSIKVNVEFCFIQFDLVDGDADLGNDTISAIYIKDSRYEAQGFVRNDFPQIDPAIEDPTKGIEGYCVFTPLDPPVPRLDSLHTATGDTLSYEFYIKDRAGNESNHLTTPSLIVRP